MKARTKLEGVQVVKKPTADGGVSVYYYHRATRTKLPGKPSSPEFKAALLAANTGRKAEVPANAATVASLIREFSTSAEWRAFADATKEYFRLNLKAVEDKWGKLPLVVFGTKAIRADVLTWRDELALKHPRAADAKVSAFARVLSWGVDRAKVADNPLEGIKKVYRSDRADKIWLPEHVAAIAATAKPELKLALMLALHTGQRQADIRAMTWAQYDGKAITVVQGKTKRPVWIPCTRALKLALDGATRRGDTIVTDRRGGLWEKRAFARAWEVAYKAAGLPEGDDSLNFHDLRGTAVTMLSEAGAIPQEIATITGHTLASVNRILETYLSRTRALAQSAIDKLETHARNAA
jgi:integrase